jgi:hypothetical protein
MSMIRGMGRRSSVKPQSTQRTTQDHGGDDGMACCVRRIDRLVLCRGVHRGQRQINHQSPLTGFVFFLALVSVPVWDRQTFWSLEYY